MVFNHMMLDTFRFILLISMFRVAIEQMNSNYDSGYQTD